MRRLLIEYSKILSNYAEVTECLNEYLYNTKDSFDIHPIFKEVQENLSAKQVVLRIINKCKDHPTIRVIKQHVLPNANAFSIFSYKPN